MGNVYYEFCTCASYDYKKLFFLPSFKRAKLNLYHTRPLNCIYASFSVLSVVYFGF